MRIGDSNNWLVQVLLGARGLYFGSKWTVTVNPAGGVEVKMHFVVAIRVLTLIQLHLITNESYWGLAILSTEKLKPVKNIVVRFLIIVLYINTIEWIYHSWDMILICFDGVWYRILINICGYIWLHHEYIHIDIAM